MQIYGIDLAKEKFDVSFFDLTSKKVSNQPSHKVVTNNLKGIGKFFKGLPSDAVLVAEHTGVYGDTLLKCCMDSNVKIAFVGGYVIHRYRATPDRAKTDVLDCALLRDFGERYPDKLKYKTFPEEALYELRQLARHREMRVEQRKQLRTADRSEECRPIRSLAVKRSMDRIKEMLDTEIAETEKEMLKVINGHESIHHNYELVKSVDGVGLITAVELLVKTENFTKITIARQYAAYAGTAPYEKSSGKMDKGAHISKIGNRRSKTLLYICAESARLHNKEIKLYYERRTLIDKKPRHYVLNAIANKLLRIIFTLVEKGEYYDANFIRQDPRVVKYN